MSGINFLSVNRIDNASFTVTTGAENAQFPLENLLNETTANKFRSVGNTVVFYADLTTTQTIDTIALVGDQAGQIGVSSVDVRTSATTTFAGPYTSVPLSTDQNIGYVYIPSVDHRYVEFTLTGTGSYAEVSNIFVGERLNLPQNSISIGSFKYGYGDRSSIRQNRYGQKFIDERNLQKRIGGSIEYCTKDEQDDLDTMFQRHGKNRPLWLILDADDAAMTDGQYKLSMYGYLKESPDWSAAGGQLYSTSIEMDETV